MDVNIKGSVLAARK